MSVRGFIPVHRHDYDEYCMSTVNLEGASLFLKEIKLMDKFFMVLVNGNKSKVYIFNKYNKKFYKNGSN